MNAAQNIHNVRLVAPYYAARAGAQLHRYLVPEFVPRFLQQLSSNRLDDPETTAWQQSDRFSRHDQRLVLRLPMHKTFYLVSTEVICDRPGRPALDGARITSAGYVIRRRRDGREYSWMIANDEAMGWEESATGLRDPDADRRMCRDRSLHGRPDQPAYNGEQTYPLHVQTAYDAQGKRHTILYGYVALGGSYIPQRINSGDLFDAQSLNDFSNAARQHLPWPFGERPPRNGTLSKVWHSRFSRPVNRGVPSGEWFELLRLLINRYHLGEAGHASNESLQLLAESIYFYDVDALTADAMQTQFNDYTRDNYLAWRRYSLWQWLRDHFGSERNTLVNWMAVQEKLIDASGGIATTLFPRLPDQDGSASSLSLFITASDAREFRTLLDQRVTASAATLASEMPMPKFLQEAGDIYQLVPFLRARNDQGKEFIYWADGDARSELFRVASPFDPHASRPAMIQMPSLRDLRAGMARGVGMITPPDTFNLLNALNLKKGASEDVLPGEEPGGVGIQWICSFSLPAIMLVAMILLMIMISLLNIVFFWLPWIKICLPFPKIK